MQILSHLILKKKKRSTYLEKKKAFVRLTGFLQQSSHFHLVS